MSHEAAESVLTDFGNVCLFCYALTNNCLIKLNQAWLSEVSLVVSKFEPVKLIINFYRLQTEGTAGIPIISY